MVLFLSEKALAEIHFAWRAHWKKCVHGHCFCNCIKLPKTAFGNYFILMFWLDSRQQVFSFLFICALFCGRSCHHECYFLFWNTYWFQNDLKLLLASQKNVSQWNILLMLLLIDTRIQLHPTKQQTTCIRKKKQLYHEPNRKHFKKIISNKTLLLKL